MGMRSIAVYSDADVQALHVSECDEAVRIGAAPARDSYLNIDAVMGAALKTGAQAIHPGYGFLSENAAFAQACANSGITFVGPSPQAMRAMGDKIAAKETVAARGVPTVPGFAPTSQSASVLERAAREIGAPLLIKAAAGGGGRGMRLVTDLDRFSDELQSAQREAEAAFGDPTVFLERYIRNPRHIEVQILADRHGTCLALGERECSIQRRYQKVLEEAPSPAVDAALRRRLQEAAVSAAQAVNYVNAGTVEFMLEPGGRFYFLEMNARLQVEHPVTEAVTGTDLVREQFAIAAGEKLAIDPVSVSPRGHAIEVRIYAEDPAHGFLPSSGRIEAFSPPEGPGVRNDVAVASGSVVSSYYDPMLAKLIVYDRTRAQCVQRLKAALADYVVAGVTTNIAFLSWLVAHEAFAAGDTATDFLQRHFDASQLSGRTTDPEAAMVAAVALQCLPSAQGSGDDAWQRLGGWRHASSQRSVRFSSPPSSVELEWSQVERAWRCRAGGSEASVPFRDGLFWFDVKSAAAASEVPPRAARKCAAWLTPDGVAVTRGGATYRMKLAKAPAAAAEASDPHAGEAGTGLVQAPMSGTIIKTHVKAGQTISALEPLLAMEAMKMEHSIVAPYPGTVSTIAVQAGDTVAAGDVLVEIAEG